MSEVILRYNLDITDQSRWIPVTVSQTARNELIYPQEIGDFFCGAEYYTYRQGLASYQIILSAAGKGHLKYRGNEYELPAGSLIMLNCSEEQYYYTDKQTGSWHTVWVHLFGANAKAYFDIFDRQNHESPLINVGGDSTIRTLIDMLLNIYKNPGTTMHEDLQAASILTQIMTHCILNTRHPLSSDRSSHYVSQVRSYIELHYAERVTLDALAADLSVNKFYLQKLFKRSVGISPNEFLIQVRLNRAKQLLRGTTMPISHIAGEVGMTNIGHFLELFKRYEGTTPGMYRKQWYNNEIEEDM